MLKIIVKGLASGKQIASLNNPVHTITLLQLLRKNNIPIASSCDGEGVCKKCVFNHNKLACKQILPINDRDLIVEIDYL